MDQLIRCLYDYTTEQVFPLANPSAGERLALVAIGGYGRGELAPSPTSICCSCCPTSDAAWRADRGVHALSAVGSRPEGRPRGALGRGVRAPGQGRHGDPHRLLEARFLWGDQPLYAELKARLRRRGRGRQRPRLRRGQARRARRAPRRVGDTRYVLEPNIKEGKGGLRDLHTLLLDRQVPLPGGRRRRPWSSRGVLTPRRRAASTRPQRFLWTVRCHLHYLAGRAEDRLTFDVQPEIARRIGYTDHAGTPRRRALHEALLPGGQGRRRPDPHLLRRSRGRAQRKPPAAAARLGLLPARGRRLPARGRAARHRQPRLVHQGPGRT